MATNQWIAAAVAVPQVDQSVPANVSTGATFTIAINGMSLTYTALSTDTVSLVVSGLLNILQGKVASQPVPPYFSKLTWAGVGTAGSYTALQATGETDGRPFTLSSSASGGSATFVTSTTTAPVSPSDVGLAANWTLGVPVNGQDVLVTGANGVLPGLLYNLTALAGVTPNSFTSVANKFQIGLPYQRLAGYVEYLPLNLQFAAGTMSLTINNASSLMNFDFQAGTVTATILATGPAPTANSANSAPASLNFINGPTTITMQGGNASVAMLPGATATISGNVNIEGGNLQLGTGVTMTGSVTVSGGGTLTSSCNLGTIVVNAASWTHLAGTVASPTLQNGGRVTYDSSGTVTGTLILGPGGCAADFSGNTSGCTLTHCTMYLGSTFNDPNRAVTLSNQVQLSQCGFEDVSIIRGKNILVTI